MNETKNPLVEIITFVAVFMAARWFFRTVYRIVFGGAGAFREAYIEAREDYEASHSATSEPTE